MRHVPTPFYLVSFMHVHCSIKVMIRSCWRKVLFFDKDVNNRSSSSVEVVHYCGLGAHKCRCISVLFYWRLSHSSLTNNIFSLNTFIELGSERANFLRFMCIKSLKYFFISCINIIESCKSIFWSYFGVQNMIDVQVSWETVTIE